MPKRTIIFFLFGKFKEMNLSIFFLFNSSFPLDFQTHYMNFSEFLLKKCVKTHVFLNSSGLNEPLVIFCLDRICKNNPPVGGDKSPPIKNSELITLDTLRNVMNILRNIRLNFSQSERHDEMLGLLASLLANGTNKLVSMGSQPNLKFNFNWVTAHTII